MGATASQRSRAEQGRLGRLNDRSAVISWTRLASDRSHHSSLVSTRVARAEPAHPALT